jgi:hypothetical protein
MWFAIIIVAFQVQKQLKYFLKISKFYLLFNEITKEGKKKTPRNWSHNVQWFRLIEAAYVLLPKFNK